MRIALEEQLNVFRVALDIYDKKNNLTQEDVKKLEGEEKEKRIDFFVEFQNQEFELQLPVINIPYREWIHKKSLDENFKFPDPNPKMLADIRFVTKIT